MYKSKSWEENILALPSESNRLFQVFFSYAAILLRWQHSFVSYLEPASLQMKLICYRDFSISVAFKDLDFINVWMGASLAQQWCWVLVFS